MNIWRGARSENLLAAFAVVVHAAMAPLLAEAQSVPTNLALTVDDPRPLAKAADELMARYGYLITYEDPRYAYVDDLRDVTSEVRKNTAQRSVLVPAGGVLELRDAKAPAAGDAQAGAAVLSALIDVQSIRSNGGRFQLLQGDDRFHLVPVQVRDSKGQWTAQSSVLDTPITIPSAERDGIATLSTILAAVQKASGESVSLGTAPLNLLYGSRITLGAGHERARDVLVRALDATGRRVTWRLFYAPDLKFYALNLKTVPNDQQQKQSDVQPAAPAPPTGSVVSPTGAPRR